MTDIRATDTMQEPGEKKRGFAHLLAAGGYSLAGFLRAVKESAFRHEIVFFVASLTLFAWIGASLAERDSALGRLRYALPPVSFEGGPRDWARPPGVWGADPAAWR